MPASTFVITWRASTLPTLVIVTTHDQFITPDLQHRRAAAIAGARTVEIDLAHARGNPSSG
ncbi:hypothetical protein GCM10023320_80740 [Pseudonocardia adelaidensis]|uniref:Alpha/beta hydrolase family protein n=1 Tax=Pseudonocardia adelaidensis TaxID=648754 RepID=A0ABP9PBA4_9PSEU